MLKFRQFCSARHHTERRSGQLPSGPDPEPGPVHRPYRRVAAPRRGRRRLSRLGRVDAHDRTAAHFRHLRSGQFTCSYSEKLWPVGVYGI